MLELWMQCSWFYLARGWTGALKLKQHAIWFTIWHTGYNSYLPFALHAIFTYLPTNIIPPTTQFPSTMRLADIKDCLKTLSVLVLALTSCWEITSHFNCQISLAHPGGCWPPTPSPRPKHLLWGVTTHLQIPIPLPGKGTPDAIREWILKRSKWRKEAEVCLVLLCCMSENYLI